MRFLKTGIETQLRLTKGYGDEFYADGNRAGMPWCFTVCIKEGVGKLLWTNSNFPADQTVGYFVPFMDSQKRKFKDKATLERVLICSAGH